MYDGAYSFIEAAVIKSDAEWGRDWVVNVEESGPVDLYACGAGHERSGTVSWRVVNNMVAMDQYKESFRHWTRPGLGAHGLDAIGGIQPGDRVALIVRAEVRMR